MITPDLRFSGDEGWFPLGVEESLKHLGYEWRGNSFYKAGQVVKNLNFPSSMKPLDLPPVAYHRTVLQADLYWHQFWFWYLYNPKSYLGSGEHEGDWEMVQYGCVDKEGNKPVLVTASQHHTGIKTEYWMRSATPIYVAYGSHAHYFNPTHTIEDNVDGKGKLLSSDSLEVREFGPWYNWPGKWGNSTGVGKSPESPGLQHLRWSTPALYHARSTWVQ